MESLSCGYLLTITWSEESAEVDPSEIAEILCDELMDLVDDVVVTHDPIPE